MLPIIKEALADLSILISSAYILSKLSKTLFTHQSPFVHKLFVGIGNGIAGIILMNFAITYQDKFLIDIRLVPIVMASFSYGGIAPLIASIIIGSSRFFYGFSPTIIGVFITYCLIGFSQYFISSWLQDKKECQRLMLIFTCAIIPVILNFIIHSTYSDNTLIIIIFIVYNLVGLIVSYQFSKDIETTKKNFLHYESVSKYDYLTTIFNRYSFDRDLTALFEQEKEVTLFLLDVNDFKIFNDTYGHDSGDLILKQFSKCLLTLPFLNHSVYRMGGDEFAIIIPTALSNEAISSAKQTIKQAVKQLLIPLNSQHSISISVSIGCSLYTSFQTIDELYRQADLELYLDKKLK